MRRSGSAGFKVGTGIALSASMANTDNIGSRYFNRATLRILARKGITVIGATFAPDAKGSYANGETVFCLDDNGTHRVRTFLHVLAIAEGTLASTDVRAEVRS